MQILLAPLEQIALGEKTKFSAEEAAGQTVLSVENTQGFAVNNYIILGQIGSELAEIVQISSVSTNSITTGVTKFIHKQEEPITKTLFNKRKFYRSTTESGTYSHLSSEGSPVDIQVDQPEGTSFEDSTGTSSSWYKATYYNSTSGLESSIDDAIATKAGDVEAYTSIYKIRSESGFEENDYISTEVIARYRDEAQMQVDGVLAIAYSLPLSTIPKLITHITTLLAAGLLLSKEYGVEADVDVSKTGQRKIERAEALLQKIIDGTLLLVNSDGTQVSKNSSYRAAGSNVYDSSIADRGELFNIRDENFKLTDPAEPTSSGDRVSEDYQKVGTQWSSQK